MSPAWGLRGSCKERLAHVGPASPAPPGQPALTWTAYATHSPSTRPAGALVWVSGVHVPCCGGGGGGLFPCSQLGGGAEPKGRVLEARGAVWLQEAVVVAPCWKLQNG